MKKFIALLCLSTSAIVLCMEKDGMEIAEHEYKKNLYKDVCRHKQDVLQGIVDLELKLEDINKYAPADTTAALLFQLTAMRKSIGVLSAVVVEELYPSLNIDSDSSSSSYHSNSSDSE